MRKREQMYKEEAVETMSDVNILRNIRCLDVEEAKEAEDILNDGKIPLLRLKVYFERDWNRPLFSDSYSPAQARKKLNLIKEGNKRFLSLDVGVKSILINKSKIFKVVVEGVEG